jgi:ABC-type uncharacterized transport system permease subunit
MIPMLIFGILGGVVSAVVAWPYGFVAAFAAYVVGGSMCALVPGVLQMRSEAKAEARNDVSALMKASPVGEEQ